MTRRGRRIIPLGLTLLALVPGAAADDTLPRVPLPHYHLTARPWASSGVNTDDYLATVAGCCRYLATLQDASGAIVDPFVGREFQYATPYFAAAVATLVRHGMAEDLHESGIRAMERATEALAGGWRAIPDAHGEFFLAPLAAAMERYTLIVDEQTAARWRERLRVPIDQVMRDRHGRINNWRTYAMKGEWLRHQQGLIERQSAEAFIVDAWLRRTQRTRLAADRWNMYQDWSSDPQSHAVEAVGRSNLLGLVATGYDGPFADEMRRFVERGTRASLLWQSPDGQCPPNGRTDDHVFNDVVYLAAFETMAARLHAAGETGLSGQYRRAAHRGWQSIQRWQRDDGAWQGSFYVTKNRLDPARRVGYQPASQYTNYNGAIAYHLAEAAEAAAGEIAERPTPAEIGGYAVVADPSFSSAVLNAGGLQLVINLRGDSVPKYGKYWTPLGIVRIARVGFDGRLGPSDGAHDADTGHVAVLGPAWRRGQKWEHVAAQASDYRGTLNVTLCHPLLIRAEVLFHTVTGSGGPTFLMRIVLTPDGALFTLSTDAPIPFGMTLPLLVDDGASLHCQRDGRIASVRHPDGQDEQNFIVVSENSKWSTEPAALSSYGMLQPWLVQAEGAVQVFVYPRSGDDATAEDVARTWQSIDDGFRSAVAQVRGNVYIGRHAAGGIAEAIDLDADGRPEIRLSRRCGVIVTRDSSGSRPTAIESDRAVDVEHGERTLRLVAFEPQPL